MMLSPINTNTGSGSNNNNSNNIGSPSKHKKGFGGSGNGSNGIGSSGIGSGSSSAANASSAPAPASTTGRWRTTRWILFGFGVGTATTALFHSVNMPTIRVELEYDDAPSLHRPRQHQHHHHRIVKKSSFIIGGSSNNSSNDDEDGTDGTTITKTNAINTATAGDMERWKMAQEEILQKNSNNNNNNGLGGGDEKKEPRSVRTDNNNNNNNIVNNNNNNRKTPEEMEEEELTKLFSDPGPVPKLKHGEAFAACILIKDDNHWLIEWLAYHYHVMPLRYLIVAIDPNSKTTPIPILKRWKDGKLMTISIWDDTMFMPTKINANPKMFDNNTELMMHRVRQNNFYFKCMKTFKQRNREWLMLIDTDEYIVTNYASGIYYNMTKHIPITRPGNVLTFIKQHHQLTGENHTCSYMPRYMFGVKETTDDMVQRHMPAGAAASGGWNGSNFLTQRFIYRNPRRMHNGKNLINLQKMPQIKTYTSVHHVSSHCPDPDKMRTVNHVKRSLVRVHHYLGTEEQYFFRSDPRQSKGNSTTTTTTNQPTIAPTVAPTTVDGETSSAANATTTTTTNTTNTGNKTKLITAAYFTRGKGRYEMLNKRSNYPDQGARAWIRGFIQDVGLDRASMLLHGVGQVGYEGTEEEMASYRASSAGSSTNNKRTAAPVIFVNKETNEEIVYQNNNNDNGNVNKEPPKEEENEKETNEEEEGGIDEDEVGNDNNEDEDENETE